MYRIYVSGPPTALKSISNQKPKQLKPWVL